MKRVAITPLARPVQARVAIPGSKSYTNRALLLAALAGGRVTVRNPLISDDTHAMISCLRALGLRCAFKEDVLEVEGDIFSISDKDYTLNANLSGTTIRFLLALSAIIPGKKTILGRGRLNERPIAHLVEALERLGAQIEYLGHKGYPPVRVLSSHLESGTTVMKGTVSSQFLSALLMIAPAVGDMTIEVEGEQISKPYIDMTVEGMKKFGVDVENAGYERYHVSAGQVYRPGEYVVEGDVSSASYFAAIAALTASTITVTNINPSSLQADIRFFKILEGMGARVTHGENEMTVAGSGVHPVNVSMEDCPDQAQTLAVLAAFAKGTTTITGIRSLRVKETERVKAVETELAKMGIKTESTDDTLVIHGGNPRAAAIDTYGDHRMAMAFAVAATKLPGIEIREPDVVSKTFPHFWDALQSIGVTLKYRYEEPNIVLIGMRGGGKTTVAKLLAARLQREFVDLDVMVEKKAAMTIMEMIKKYGWDYFRDRESDVVAEAAKMRSTVLSTGGGVIGRPENIAALKQRGILIFLSAPADVLARRISSDAERPRLTQAAATHDEVEAVLAERKKLYEAVADIVVDASNMTPEEEVEAILPKLTERGII